MYNRYIKNLNRHDWLTPRVMKMQDKRPTVAIYGHGFPSIKRLVTFLVWIATQTNHTSNRIFKKKWLIPPPAISIQNLKKTMKMTWHFVISAVWASTVFVPHLWQHCSYWRSLADSSKKSSISCKINFSRNNFGIIIWFPENPLVDLTIVLIPVHIYLQFFCTLPYQS